MKRNILGLLLAISVLATSCYKDEGNYSYTDNEKISITGIESSYTKISAIDSLKINPVVESNIPNADYEYRWYIYDNTIAGAKVDTICKAKDINYRVVQQARSWALVFSAKDKNTGYTQYVSSTISVTTQFTKGWFVSKSDGGDSDIDMFFTKDDLTPAGAKLIPTGVKAENVFSGINGQGIPGTKGFFVFWSDYKTLDLITNPAKPAYVNTRVLIHMTDQEASVIKIDNFSEIRKLNDLFYAPPSTKNPNFLFKSNSVLYLSNANQLYPLTSTSGNTGQWGVSSSIDAINTPYKLSKYYYCGTSVPANPILFDELSSSFISSTTSSILTSLTNAPKTQLPCKNNNKTLLFMGNTQEFGGTAIVQDKTDPSVKILCKFSGGSNTLNITNDTLKPTQKLYSGSLYALNYKDESIIYFVSDNQVWSRNLVNKTELLQYTPPAGETIVYIKHRWTYSLGLNHIVVATQSGNNYTVRMFKKSAGNLAAEPEIVLQGNGIFSDVIFVSPSVLTNTYQN